MIDQGLVQILELLKTTNVVDSIKVNGDTQYEMDIIWNPDMNNGEYEAFTEENGYEDYTIGKSAMDMARTINPMYLQVMDWIPDDWDNADDTVNTIVDELTANKYEWHQLTDDIICECARMLGICD